MTERNQKFLCGKRILFLEHQYYEYHIEIKQALQKAGAIVDNFSVMKKSPIFTILRNINQAWFDEYNRAYGNEILKEIYDQAYDFIIVIQGYQLSDDFFVELRKLNPNAVFINYQWDSVWKTVFGNTYLDRIHHYDKVFSFDRKDCENYAGLNYLPLFYTDNYAILRKCQSESECDIDLLFIGSVVNYRRYQLVQQVEKLCEKMGIVFVSYLYVTRKNYLKSILRGRLLRNVNFIPLTQKDILNLFDRSKAIIDLPNHTQTGLTMRVVEVLGAGKKLITTNAAILDEDIYNKNQINVVDIENIKIDKHFIQRDLESNNNEIDGYSIDNWIRNIFQGSMDDNCVNAK